MDSRAVEISDENIKETTIDPLQTQTKSKAKAKQKQKQKLLLIHPPCDSSE